MGKSIVPGVVFSLTVLSTSAMADQSIFSSKVDSQWVIWPWAKAEVKGGAISVTTKKDWEALYLHHDPERSAGYSALTFKVNGGAKGGQKLQVRIVSNKQPLKEAFLKPLDPGKWTTVTIPLKNLGLTGQAFEGIWIQAQKPCSFQVQSIALKK